MTLIIYISITLISMQVDAMLCVMLKHKYKFWPSVLLTLCWPVVIPIAILVAVYVTRNYPKFKLRINK